MTQLRPFFSFYGGKYRCAPHYPKPQYDLIVEPFAGSAGYSVRYPERKVILYEIDPKVAGVWDYLIHASESEIRSLPLTFGHISELSSSIPTEAKHLIGFWLNKGNQAPCLQPSAWMRSGIRPNSFWGEAIRERVASQVHAIRHWEIRHRSYETADNLEATWFIDPPYSSPAGRHYKYDRIDFDFLSTWSRERRGQVIVCEQEGAGWLPFLEFRTIKSLKYKQCKEVVWLSDAPTVTTE